MRWFFAYGNIFFAGFNISGALDGQWPSLVAIMICVFAAGFLFGGKYGG